MQQGLPTGTIYDIWQTRDGFLWLGTQTGLVRFDGVRYTPAETLFSGIPDNLWIRAGFEDEHGALWVGTNDGGIFRFQDGKAERFSTREGMPSDQVFCMVPAAGGGLWACTGNGLVRFADGKISVLRTRDDATPDVIRAGCLAAGGKLWVGGDDPAVYSQNGDGFDSIPLRLIPSDASVRAMACSGQSMWVGTTAGLVQVKGTTQRLFTQKDGLVDDGVLSLHEGQDGSLWIGTRSGFSRLRNGEFESFRPQDGLSQSSVFSVFEDREGSLWVGTKHGLNQFVDGRAVPYTANEGLPSNAAGPLFQDSTGGIWVGTLDAGLAKFDGRHFSTQSVRQGLASNTILALADAGDGAIWAGTARGLNLLRNGRVAAVYTKESGLPADEVRALRRDYSGTLWVGTAAGIAVFKDGTFTIPKAAPRDPVLALGVDREGRPLFSTEHGLFRVAGAAVEEVAPGGVALRSVDAIYRDPDGLVWLATNGNGLRLLDERTAETKTTQFFMRDGMFDSEIYGIVPDELGNLWLACSKGIFSVVRSELLRFAAGGIKKVSSTQYSPTDALRVIECKPGVQPGIWRMNDGRVWFSTIRGLIVLDPAHLQRKVPPPPVVIEDPIVNGQSERPARIGSLAPGQKSLEFNLHRIELSGAHPHYVSLHPGGLRQDLDRCRHAAGGVLHQSSSAHVPFSSDRVQRRWFVQRSGKRGGILARAALLATTLVSFFDGGFDGSRGMAGVSDSHPAPAREI